VEAIAGDKSLKDHGADSVDRVEIILSIMNRLGIDEPMSNFSGIPTSMSWWTIYAERDRRNRIGAGAGSGRWH